MHSETTAPPVIGIGLRHPHYQRVLTERPWLSFLEVHSENFFATGGAVRQVLRNAREHYAISLHGVSLALGSAVGIDVAHLETLSVLVREIEPVRVSDHLCFARASRTGGAQVTHANDLLPAAFTEASLAIFAANIDRVESRLQRPILVENLSSYVQWCDNAYSETDFLNTLCKRTGCKLVVDVNNVVVNMLNDAATRDLPVAATCAWLDAIAPEYVAEMHLAGYCVTDDWVIDDHGSRVHAPVWAAYAHAVRRFGAVPTCIEWDTNVPTLDVLLGEAARAESVVADALGQREHEHA